MREAPATDVIKALLKAGATVRAFDPKATHEAAKVFGDSISYQKDDMYAVLENADALIIFTEWKEFYSPNFLRIKESLKSPLIFDGRNIFTLDEMKEQGFLYYSIGRSKIC
jgi:UDPglucose 6-dehydrogenase